jgi:hypothetical protein
VFPLPTILSSFSGEFSGIENSKTKPCEDPAPIVVVPTPITSPKSPA